jgi:hypothetical protein
LISCGRLKCGFSGNLWNYQPGLDSRCSRLFTTMEMEYSNKGRNNMSKKIKQMEK